MQLEKFKMNALGKYCHDFPRLAKESGYNFQLYRGRINWSDLEKVSIQEIIEDRNFKLLEQNLIHVINCNLDREYDVKILDQNFVKLFKLAQLGVDYLSYCELYLDRCVVLLQEQLSSYQEECAQLREENEKKEEELKKSRKKVKQQSQNYKCNKCEKLFLNEAYLESHDKRRHRKPPEEHKVEKAATMDHAQQTEEEKKSVLTQTADRPSFSNSEVQVGEGPEILKISEQESKIDSLKKDLEELKLRLSLAEKTMEKKNDERTFQSNCTFPGPVIPVIHSYIPPPSNGYVQVTSSPPGIVPGFHSKFMVHEEVANEHQEAVRRMSQPQMNEYPAYNGSRRHHFRQISLDDPPIMRTLTPERISPEGSGRNQSDSVAADYVSTKEDKPSSPPQRPYVDTQVVDVKMDRRKSNEEPEEAKKEAPKKLKDPPRLLEVEDITNDFHSGTFGSSPVRSCPDLKFETESLSENLELRTSTPVKRLTATGEGSAVNKWSTDMATESDGIAKGSAGKQRERRSKSHETLVREMNVFDEKEEEVVKPKSLLRKIVTKKKPKIQGLTASLKNSFSNLYGSVSRKNGETESASLVSATKSDIVEGLHSRLKELGIDPEWSGIPKETMKQKLKILQHHRNLLTKENRLYPLIRRKLEKHVLKKLKSKENVQTSAESLPTPQTPEPDGIVENAQLDDSNEIVLYDTDRDSDIEILDSNKNNKSNALPSPARKTQNIAPGSLDLVKPSGTTATQVEERETDFSIFQAGRFREVKIAKAAEPETPKESVEKAKCSNTTDELETDSDFDDELFREFEVESSRTMAQHTANKAPTPKRDVIGSFPANPEISIDRMSVGGNAKLENQSILKTDAENKAQKKKVLFAEEPEIFDSSLDRVANTSKSSIVKRMIQDAASTIQDDDDDWSIESEWTVNNPS